MMTLLKHHYVAYSHDLEVVKKIKQNEVVLRDQNIVLHRTKANVRNLPRKSLKIHS